jgi:hypothetical protein
MLCFSYLFCQAFLLTSFYVHLLHHTLVVAPNLSSPLLPVMLFLSLYLRSVHAFHQVVLSVIIGSSVCSHICDACGLSPSCQLICDQPGLLFVQPGIPSCPYVYLFVEIVLI